MTTHSISITISISNIRIRNIISFDLGAFNLAISVSSILLVPNKDPTSPPLSIASRPKLWTSSTLFSRSRNIIISFKISYKARWTLFMILHQKLIVLFNSNEYPYQFTVGLKSMFMVLLLKNYVEDMESGECLLE